MRGEHPPFLRRSERRETWQLQLDLEKLEDFLLDLSFRQCTESAEGGDAPSKYHIRSEAHQNLTICSRFREIHVDHAVETFGRNQI